jgi:hypothetical protein
MSRRVVMILAILLSVSPLSAQDPCASITRQGIFDQSRYTNDQSYKEVVDDFVYVSDFQTHDEAIRAGLSVGAIVYGVPLRVGGTFTREQRDTWKHDFESRHRQNIDRASAISSFRTQADPNLLSAWLECIKTTTNALGLKAGLDPLGKRSVFFWVSYNPSGTNDPAPKITSIQLVGLKASQDLKNKTIPNTGIGAYYEVTDSAVAVAITTNSKGTVRAQLDYANYQENVSERISSSALATAGFVVGEIRAFAFSDAKQLEKQGWIECDGRSLQDDKYAELFKALGNAWGSDTPGIAFKISDLRGYFMRGWDHGAKHDPDAANRGAISAAAVTADNVGSLQSFGIQTHSHGTPIPGFGNFSQGDSGGGSHLGITGGTWSTNNAGGAETRPVNVYVLYAIYTGVPK